MITIDNKDWRKRTQVSEMGNYMTPLSLINPDLVKNSKVLSSANAVS